ncbi:ROK family protein [Leucobacter allii]|uniref:ROK family protein n=1 Tax=Leucobacter allii TaxID=2932247 RepID=UPI001FD3CB9B|nr:ROK family protein [Leucobacter allii]UOR01004.1 ROK family protein [Leucobacter allii]
MSDRLRIGMDIGGTKTEAVAIDAAGGVVATALLPTPPGVEPVLATAEQAIAELAAQTGRGVREFASVGVGIPGQVDRASGEVRLAYNIGIEHLALAARLGERTSLPVALDNDVNAAALGAAHLMGLDGTVSYLNIGTGLAEGLVIDGALQRGAHGITGEIGHFAIDPLGRQCLCGQLGCLETAASGAALRNFWPAGGEHPGRTLLPAVDAGDAEAQAAFEHLVRGSATAIRLLVLLLDPHTVVIGGGLRLLGDRFFDAIRGRLAEWGAQSPFIAELGIAERIRLLPEGSPAAAVGAALAGADRPGERVAGRAGTDAHRRGDAP